ncbi:MAG: glutamine amidotransferase, partial [Oscillospiraceae bacterium]
KIPMGPDREQAIYDYVIQGGGFMMVGGWLSFSGLQGKGLYGGTQFEEIMPVTCEPRGVDDRVEVTQGYSMDIHKPNHPIVKGLPWDEKYTLLGYNKVHLREDAELIASWRGDVQIATRQVGQGRSCVFTCDVGPHWGGDMLQWSGYNVFWQNLVRWTAGKI